MARGPLRLALRALPAALLAAALLVPSAPSVRAAQAAPRQARPAAQEQPAPAPADPRRTPVVRVVQEAGPAVVSITAVRASEQSGFSEAQAQPAQPADPKKKIVQNLGSGVIIDGRRAYVLTNAHVITGAARISVRLLDGREFTAVLMGADQDMDLAVLRLDLSPTAPPLPQARMGDSSTLLPGEPLIAIGNPFGLSHTVTTGVASAVERSVNTGQQTITGLIQTDAAINPGNSGGPLLNILGEVVGINAAMYAKGGGLGFAIPINRARRVLDELIATGRVAHIWLGLLGENMAQDQAAFYNLPRPAGMVVTDVFPGTPAEAAGIRPGDALLTLGGQKVQDKAQFLGLLLSYTRGDTVAVQLSRGPEQFQVQMRPQVLEREAALGLIRWRWGFSHVPQGQAGPQATAAGVGVADVRANSPAARLGLKPGDTIVQVGNLRTNTEQDLISAFFRYQMHNLLIVSVKRGPMTYAVRMKL